MIIFYLLQYVNFRLLNNVLTITQYLSIFQHWCENFFVSDHKAYLLNLHNQIVSFHEDWTYISNWLKHSVLLLARWSQFSDWVGRHIVFWEMVFGNFMISRPILGCSHWLEFVYIRMLSRRHYVHSNEPVGELQCQNLVFNVNNETQ